MELTPLTALSPVDGRYFTHTQSLSPYFSEYGLIRYRLRVEVEYFIALSGLGLAPLDRFPVQKQDALRALYRDFNSSSADRIKTIEQETNHDVKALEYFMKEEFAKLGLGEFKEFIHFGLTSQDVNNTAIPLSVKECLAAVYRPALEKIVSSLDELSVRWNNIAMLARTHGQPASPTRLGKEIAVFSERLKQQSALLGTIPHSAKFGGATGNFNAHVAAYPGTDWHAFADTFLQSLGLTRSHPTTQIEHYDNLAALFQNLGRINTILIDFSRDVWQYVSMNYFRQRIKAGEVGSSAMPHKVNPIDFENAEGNLGLANTLFGHLASKLPVSRLQRDLTDSTVLRNMGVPFAHTLMALTSLERGISKLELNKEAIDKDLEENWAVVAEGIQTILRREGYPQPYEALKELTRKNSKITKEELQTFIGKLKVKESVRKELLGLSPFTYTGA